jgi:hypothetical protein
MPHITLNSADPGIRALLRHRPETGRPLSELTEVLLRGPSTLTRGERELIAVAPEDPAIYAAGAQRLIKEGYLPPA